MNTSKHTPGPYSTKEFSRGEFKYTPHIDIIGKDGQYVANVPLCLPGYSGTEEMLAERRANAALIAAAPELLEALKECESMLDEFDANSERTARIRSAIAKAEGRS